MSDYSETSQSGVVTGSLDALSDHFSGYESLPIRSHQSCNVLYRARRFGRYYVLKGLVPEYRNDPAYREFLSKEYQIGVQLDHPHIVRVNSLEEDPELGLCIVMEYVDGQSLDQWLASRPSSAARKRIFRQIMEAMAYCHNRQVWHLDLKPSNILVTQDGLTAKIIDFGLSDNCNFAFRHIGGTRQYAAPEQLENKSADLRSDIYALGGILKRMFPHRYGRAVRHAQRIDPNKRPQSVAALARLMRPRWWLWLLPVLLAFVFCWWMQPDGKVFPVTLDSGQTVYARVLSHWHKTVAFTSPNMEWTAMDDSVSPSGDIIIPAHIKCRGLQYQVTEIDSFAFFGCHKITHVSFPEGLQRIDYRAFNGCTQLSDTLVIPRSLKVLESYAFADCHSITTLVWKPFDCNMGANKVEHFDAESNFYYRCFSLKKVIVDDAVEHLPPCVFAGMLYCEDIVLPNTIRELPSDFATESDSLNEIKLPDSLRYIAHGAFYYSGIERIVIPDKTEALGSYSFSYCPNLREVDIGSGMKRIDIYAFNIDYNLQTMTVRCKVPPVMQPNSLFEIPESAVLRVPVESIEKYRQDAVWSKFKKIEPIETVDN